MAEVSGPGQFSKRTDKAVSAANRDLPNAAYGEEAAYQQQVAGAPLPTAPSSPTPQNVQGMNFNDLFGNVAQNVVPFTEESQRPDEPVTTGSIYGPGAGPEVLASQKQQNNAMAAWLPAMEFIANQPGSSDAARNLVRYLKSQT